MFDFDFHKLQQPRNLEVLLEITLLDTAAREQQPPSSLTFGGLRELLLWQANRVLPSDHGVRAENYARLFQTRAETHLLELWTLSLSAPQGGLPAGVTPGVQALLGLAEVGGLALKVQLTCLAFIFVRASLPRLRFDQLTALCWKYLFPLVFTLALLCTALPYAVTLYWLGQPHPAVDYWHPFYVVSCTPDPHSPEKICGSPSYFRSCGLQLIGELEVAVRPEDAPHWGVPQNPSVPTPQEQLRCGELRDRLRDDHGNETLRQQLTECLQQNHQLRRLWGWPVREDTTV